MNKRFPYLVSLGFALTAGSARANDLQTASVWFDREVPIAVSKIFGSISRGDSAKGSVIASPDRQDPDYYYHWVRDAALTMGSVLDIARESPDEKLRTGAESALEDYMDFSRANQERLDAPTGLGEPKFHVDGRPYTDPWGRPQNDGPALRAIVLIQWAQSQLDNNPGSAERRAAHLALMRAKFYGANSVIIKDLDFIAGKTEHVNDGAWKDESVDLWEEVRGHHFYTRMVQHKALVLGAALARRFSDSSAAQRYEKKAKLLQVALLDHTKDDHGQNPENIVRPTFFDTPLGKPEKAISQYELAILLGILHGSLEADDYTIDNAYVLHSLKKLRDAFVQDLNKGQGISTAYPINQRAEIPGLAIGRYPGDLYTGKKDNLGGAGPWVLGTMAFAEAHYRLAATYLKKTAIKADPLTIDYFHSLHNGELNLVAFRANESIGPEDPRFRPILNALLHEGDAYALRVKYHANPDGSLSEQMHRDSGYMTSARDLTWSYVSVHTAAQARRELLHSL